MGQFFFSLSLSLPLSLPIYPSLPPFLFPSFSLSSSSFLSLSLPPFHLFCASAYYTNIILLSTFNAYHIHNHASLPYDILPPSLSIIIPIPLPLSLSIIIPISPYLSTYYHSYLSLSSSILFNLLTLFILFVLHYCIRE
uniref:Uncharacterized protein n=1 Tax=Cacopsylla melanoneura TaxID=428564 RepID=A0A8D8ZEV2_9HEMI